MKNIYNFNRLSPEKMLENLLDSLVEDVLNATDEELLAQMVENGEDPEEAAKDICPLIEAALREVDNDFNTDHNTSIINDLPLTQSSKANSLVEAIPLITSLAASDGESVRSPEDVSSIHSKRLAERLALIGEKDIRGIHITFYEGSNDTVFIEVDVSGSPSELVFGRERYHLEKVNGEKAVYEVSGLSAINTICIIYEDSPEVVIGIELKS